MAYDSYNMVFTDEAEWLAFKEDKLIDNETEQYKGWVQGIHIMPKVLAYYFTGIHEDPEDPPVYQAGYFVCIMTAGRKKVCQDEVCDPYPLEQFHYFQGGQFFQNEWKKYD